MSFEQPADRRIQKTLSALREAFFELVLSQSYDEISVSDIIEKANVGRSTFYQHFKSKDDILVASMHYPLSNLSMAVAFEDSTESLLHLMEHFWENRQFAPRIFGGSARKHVVASLTDMIESQLKVASSQGIIISIPLRLAAHQLAESQLVIIIDWLTGKAHCDAQTMAKHLRKSSVALRDSILTTR